ncbi:MAG: YggT family protein [Methylococcaceae bacterium]|jgi:YggT family protein
MSTDYWINPAVFLIDTLFGLYVFALVLRFLLQWTGANYQNPISQYLIKITHAPLRVLRRVIPSLGRVDLASLILIFLLQLVSGYLVFLLKGAQPTLAAMSVWSLSQILELVLNIYFFAVIVRALLSWVGPSAAYNPVIALIYSLTEPLLQGSRRLVPATGGIDLSPMIPLIIIQLAKMLVIPPLQHLAALLN